MGESSPEGGTTPGSAPTPGVILTPTPSFSLPQNTFSEGPIVIGYSVKGRPIEVYRFGNGPVKRMIVAGIHGGYEANTIALADELIAYIEAHPEIIPHTVTLYILRNLNPDGFARAQGVDGRANENKVDLNRNFPANWEADWSRHGCWSYRPLNGGTSPGSEPETQALIAFASEVRPTAIISYHSAALGIFPGGEPADPESARLAEALAEVSDYPYPPIDTGCFYTGTLPDWAVSVGIASVDLELHNHKHTDFEENLEVLKAFLGWRR
ncbi:MAG: murein peptide amidase A [Anaerolineae bacterium]|nr:murein peptide amidase A [Anaerolineae bacterium]